MGASLSGGVPSTFPCRSGFELVQSLSLESIAVVTAVNSRVGELDFVVGSQGLGMVVKQSTIVLRQLATQEDDSVVATATTAGGSESTTTGAGGGAGAGAASATSVAAGQVSALEATAGAYIKATAGAKGEVIPLEFLAAITALCQGSIEGKVPVIFSLFDFQDTGLLSFDELVAMLLMTCRGIHTMVDVLPGGSSGAWEADTSQVQVAAEEMLASVGKHTSQSMTVPELTALVCGLLTAGDDDGDGGDGDGDGDGPGGGAGAGASVGALQQLSAFLQYFLTPVQPKSHAAATGRQDLVLVLDA